MSAERATATERATIRAVLDTSVLFPPVQRADLQQAAQLGSFIAIWSPWIIAELHRVLTWDWMRKHGTSVASQQRCSVAAKEMMTFLVPVFELVNRLPPYPPAWESLTDKWDHPLWATAVVGNADYIISDNTRHFPPRQADGRAVYQDIEYLRGRDFLNLLIR